MNTVKNGKIVYNEPALMDTAGHRFHGVPSKQEWRECEIDSHGAVKSMAGRRESGRSIGGEVVHVSHLGCKQILSGQQHLRLREQVRKGEARYRA